MALHNYLQSFVRQLDFSIFFTLGIHTLFISAKSFLQLQRLRFNTKGVTGTRKFSHTELYKANTENASLLENGGKWRKR